MRVSLHIGKWLHIRQLFTFLGWFTLLVLVYLALAHTRLDWDALAYHLPFARGTWGLPQDPRLQLPPDAKAQCFSGVYNYAQGFPKTAEVFQGFFWILCGNVNGVTIPHILLFFIYLYVIKKFLRIPASMIVVACAACPHFCVHFQSGYIDLFSNLNLALGFFLMTRFFWSLERPGIPVGFLFIYGSGTLILASNSKILALFVSLLFIGLLSLQILFRKKILIATKIKILGSLFLVGLLCLVFPIKNYLQFKNPLYPEEVKIGGEVLFSGPVIPNREEPSYQISLLNYPPIPFLLSITELDYAIRQIPVLYNIDANTGDKPRFDHWARTGGFGGFYFTLLGLILLAALIHYRAMSNSYTKLCLSNALILVTLTSFLPHSFELRYWLFIPLLVIPIALKLCMTDRMTLRAVKLMLSAFLIYNGALIYISFHEGSI